MFKCFCEQLLAERKRLGTASVCEYAEVADAGEAARQNMQQETPEKLISAECHFSFLVAVCVVLPPECDLIIFKGQQPMVGDGDPVRIARQVVQHVLGSAEGTFRVDDPVLPEQLSEELGEHFRLCDRRECTVELKFLPAEEILQRGMEFPAEYLAEHPDWQEEAWARMNPARMI